MIRESHIFFIVVACSMRGGGQVMSEADTSNGNSTVVVSSSATAVPTSTSTNDVDTSDSDITTTSESSIGEATDGGGIQPCETWNDLCPDGMKCIPYNDGGAGGPWNAQGCFPVVKRPSQVLDPCERWSPDLETLDTCEKGLVCWESQCMPLCQGTPGNFSCPSKMACALVNSPNITVCLPACDPRKDCQSPDLVCELFFNILSCNPQEVQVMLFSPCKTNSECDNGLLCVSSSAADECDKQFEGCCTAFCSIDEPVCPGAGQACVMLQGIPDIPEYQDLGFCSI